MKSKVLEAISYTRLTLGLDIIQKIPTGDFAGFHELGIIKHQVTLGDTIEVRGSSSLGVSCTHPAVPTDSRNIVWQAVEMLRQEFSIKESLHITIDKKIPVEGGLAGGSTNGATVLMLANEFWGLGLSREELATRGQKLGMDVPFYFYGGTAFDSEATGVLRPLSCARKLHFVLVVPSFGVSTASAYKGIDYSRVAKGIHQTISLEKALQEGDFHVLRESVHNDFELSVFPAYPELLFLRDRMMKEGASAAFMSGSGSTLVGLCESAAAADSLSRCFPGSFAVSTL